jgi:hypothetical protein
MLLYPALCMTPGLWRPLPICTSRYAGLELKRPCDPRKPRKKCPSMRILYGPDNTDVDYLPQVVPLARTLLLKRLPPNPGDFQETRFPPSVSTASPALQKASKEDVANDRLQTGSSFARELLSSSKPTSQLQG